MSHTRMDLSSELDTTHVLAAWKRTQETLFTWPRRVSTSHAFGVCNPPPGTAHTPPYTPPYTHHTTPPSPACSSSPRGEHETIEMQIAGMGFTVRQWWNWEAWRTIHAPELAPGGRPPGHDEAAARGGRQPSSPRGRALPARTHPPRPPEEVPSVHLRDGRSAQDLVRRGHCLLAQRAHVPHTHRLRETHRRTNTAGDKDSCLDTGNTRRDWKERTGGRAHSLEGDAHPRDVAGEKDCRCMDAAWQQRQGTAWQQEQRTAWQQEQRTAWQQQQGTARQRQQGTAWQKEVPGRGRRRRRGPP